MKPRKLMTALFAVTLMFAGLGARAHAQGPSIPEHQGRYVVDQAGVIDDGLEATLTQRLRALDDGSAHDAQVVVLTMPDCGGDENAYAVRVFEKYQPGQKGTDRGLLLLTCMQERRFRVEVGYGLEGAIPDAVAAGAVTQFTSSAKKGDFGGGIAAALDYLEPFIKGELEAQKTLLADTSQPTHSGIPWFIIIVLIGIVCIFLLLVFLSDTSSGSSGGGYYGGDSGSSGSSDDATDGMVETHSSPRAPSPPYVSPSSPPSRRRPSSTSDSSSHRSGGFGGFGGGGGFSGGGGRSGGGGASGGW